MGCNPGFLAVVDPGFVPVAQAPPGLVLTSFENDSNVTGRLRLLIQTAGGIQEVLIGEEFNDPLTSGVAPGDAQNRLFECEVDFVQSAELQVLINRDVTVLELTEVQGASGVTTIELVPVDTVPMGFVSAELIRGFPSIERPRCGSIVRFIVTGNLEVQEVTYLDPISNTLVTRPAFIRGVDPDFPRTDDFVLRATIE
jgi:hypothetical protein